MNKLVSIIIPVFNLENYISSTLKSCHDQTYNNYEVIIVDDGSSDNSCTVIKEYIKDKSKFNYFYKLNEGLSAARNYGLKIAKGDYVCFLDGDDRLAPKALQMLLDAIESNYADIVGCNFGYDLKEYTYKCSKPRLIEKDQLIDIYLHNGKECEESVCNKLFRTSLFKDIAFEQGKMHEDTFILYQLLEKSSRYVYLDEDLYNVISRQGSITRSAYSEKHYDKVIATRNIYNFYKSTKFAKAAYNKYFGTLLYFVLKTNKQGGVNHDKALGEVRQECKSNFSYLETRFIPFYVLVKLHLIQVVKL